MVQVSEEILNIQGKAVFPASRKVYAPGTQKGVNVPFREITLTPTGGRFGQEENPPMKVYDTSGPYTDDSQVINLGQGLHPLRRDWILGRGDVEEYSDPRASATNQHGWREYPGLVRQPLRAKPGRAVTQMHYARQGIVTPRDGVHRTAGGDRSGNGSRRGCPRDGPSYPPTSTIPNPSP